ncbi:MAG: hypothetical protein B7C24_00330 [Bacteroidetes bacterium 4572_77]|nr:MAG: hypothetical protein B7C24_00330 [Bacteroidetes bacterium 4572_77]
MGKTKKIRLRFSDEKTEKKFEKDYFDKSIAIFRVSFVTLIILYAAFGYLDFISSEDYYRMFFIIRYLIVIPLLVAVLLFSFNRNFIKVWQKLLSLCYVAGGAGIIIMLLKNPENIYYYGGLFLIFNAGYFFIKLRFFAATISGILLLIIYNIGIFVFQTLNNVQFDYVIITNAFYISANIISSIALYNMELLERKEFYQRNLLIDQQSEISLTNQNLEFKILDRTKQLNEHNAKLIKEIKKRELIENALIAAKEKAEESNRLKTAFLNNMSHEIRTPLNGITGFLGLLQDSELEAEDKQEYFDIINRSSQRLIDTVTNIMDISKIEAEQMEIALKELSLNEMLMEQYRFFEPQAEDKGLVLKQIPSLSDDQAIVLTDSQKLNGILTNLIKNAIKFTDRGSVTFGYNITTNTESDLLVQFFVYDTGIGVPEDRQQAIFNRFEQADIGGARTFAGSGLGLAIAKSYVEMLGGKIWLSSKKGIGTEFMFTIPYQTKTNMEEKEKQQKASFKTLTVLIAEDEKVNIQYFEVIFKDTFKQTIYVGTGQEALETCKENLEIDLILMDIRMPLMSGYTATREIRKFNKDIIIIAQTAFGLEGDNEKALEAGCNDYISKPINKKELLEKIKLHSLKQNINTNQTEKP